MSNPKRRKKRVNKLSDLAIDEVSLVDRGANQHASVVLSKRDEDDVDDDEGEDIEKSDPDPSTLHVEDDEDDEEEGEEVTETKKGFFTRLIEKVIDEESTTVSSDTGNISDMDDVTKAGFPGQQLPFQQQQMGQPAPGPQNAMPPGAQAFPAQPQQQPGMGPQMPQQQPGQMQAGPPLPDEVLQYIQQLEEALAQAQGSDNQQPSGQQEDKNVDPFRKNLDDLSDDEVTFLQELSKNLEDEDTREAVTKAMEIVEAANERATAAEEIAKSERDFRLNQEFVAKARALVNLPVSADEFGPILKKLSETLEEEEYATLSKALAAANETVANAGVFGEIGKQGGGQNYETVSKADAKAKELIEKSDGDLSHEAALSKVFEEDPGLYDEYLQEQGR